MIKLIIAGGRDFTDYQTLLYAFTNFLHKQPKENITIISGMARGADSLGIQIAINMGLRLIEMPAEWDKYGKSAGYRRNEEMAKIATHALIAWDGKSKGTGHMIDLAKKHNLVIKQIDY
jgi:hypothetical protein